MKYHYDENARKSLNVIKMFRDLAAKDENEAFDALNDGDLDSAYSSFAGARMWRRSLFKRFDTLCHDLEAPMKKLLAQYDAEPTKGSRRYEALKLLHEARNLLETVIFYVSEKKYVMAYNLVEKIEPELFLARVEISRAIGRGLLGEVVKDDRAPALSPQDEPTPEVEAPEADEPTEEPTETEAEE